MKIYNKKKFVFGIFMAALGVLNIITSIVSKDFDINSIILIIALFVMGFCAIIQSVSQRLAREDRLEELDERNRLIELKSKKKSFELTQMICLSIMLILMIMGMLSADDKFIAVGAGLAAAFAISLFAEIFTFMYYEDRN